jgi:hypothetical protein
VQAPPKYELMINLKTAKVLGPAVPPLLLARRRGDRMTARVSLLPGAKLTFAALWSVAAGKAKPAGVTGGAR